MTNTPDLGKLAAEAAVRDRYRRQLERVSRSDQQTDCIEDAVDGVMKNLPASQSGSLVVYGDPQSGKTEMMICLTARLLDDGHKTIVHLMNDSKDLLVQNLNRFQLAGLAPSPRVSQDLSRYPLVPGNDAVVFCKKNKIDLTKLIISLSSVPPVIVIDDEADYATPNAKVNARLKTKINELITTLLGSDGKYIGVTATPARLNLNNTFNTTTETWVRFRPHTAYTGQDDFFPLKGPIRYRLTRLPSSGTPDDARRALARFLITVAHLNLEAETAGKREDNYSFLVHTSGNTADHNLDRQIIDDAMSALLRRSGADFTAFAGTLYREAQILFPTRNANDLTRYVLANASRSSFVVLNNQRDHAAAGDKPTEPKCPFTVIIGGNIVSRGVTFPNLLSMYFTRDVKTKMQQDTYIQRARMFGARAKHLPYFELTVPSNLYADWHRCFVFHRLALQAIQNDKPSPVWLGDARISIAASSSIDRGTVDMDKGEMSFQMFDCLDPAALDRIVSGAPTDPGTLRSLAATVGDALPVFLMDYLDAALSLSPGTLAIHTSSSIEGYSNEEDKATISRRQGFIGTNQLELARFPKAVHHVKVFHNGRGKARVFYKNQAGMQFVQNTKR